MTKGEVRELIEKYERVTGRHVSVKERQKFEQTCQGHEFRVVKARLRHVLTHPYLRREVRFLNGIFTYDAIIDYKLLKAWESSVLTALDEVCSEDPETGYQMWYRQITLAGISGPCLLAYFSDMIAMILNRRGYKKTDAAG